MYDHKAKQDGMKPSRESRIIRIHRKTCTRRPDSDRLGLAEWHPRSITANPNKQAEKALNGDLQTPTDHERL